MANPPHPLTSQDPGLPACLARLLYILQQSKLCGNNKLYQPAPGWLVQPALEGAVFSPGGGGWRTCSAFHPQLSGRIGLCARRQRPAFTQINWHQHEPGLGRSSRTSPPPKCPVTQGHPRAAGTFPVANPDGTTQIVAAWVFVRNQFNLSYYDRWMYVGIMARDDRCTLGHGLAE